MFFDLVTALIVAGSPAWGILGATALTHHSEPAPRYTAPVGHLPTDAQQRSEGVLGRFNYAPPRDPEMRRNSSTVEVPWPGSGSAH